MNFGPAIFSKCRAYRYTLVRDFPQDDMFAVKQESYVQFVGLNPSTADETKDDPTIRRCINFSKAWGYQRFVMTNLFAFRSTNPDVMMEHSEPIGEQNDYYLTEVAKGAGIIIAAWGKHGAHLNRAAHVMSILPPEKLHRLRLNKDGSPEHPLYIPADTKPTPYVLSTQL